MTQRTILAPVALFFALAAGAASAQAACEDVVLRIWHAATNQDTFYQQGETIVLEPGKEAHLYVQHKSQSKFPYSTSAEVSHVPDRRGADRGVLVLRPQGADDLAQGRQIIDTQSPGKTTLSYRITSVSQPGVFDQLPANCRTGRVEIEVRGAGGSTPPPPANDDLSPGQAARQMAVELRRGLLFWQRADVEREEQAEVMTRGRDALIEIAGRILSSESYRAESFNAVLAAHPNLRPATPERVADQLLATAYEQLFGNLPVSERERASHRTLLMSCLTARHEVACRDLSRALIEHANYASHNRARLDRLRR